MTATDSTAWVSIARLAELSLVVYADDPVPLTPGWEVVETYRTDYAFSALFRHRAADRFVLANRGTDSKNPFGEEWRNNYGMGAVDKLPAGARDRLGYGLHPTARRHAHHALLRAAAVVGPRDFYVTGHSQGGAMAILQAAARRLPGVVFNPMTIRLGPGAWDRTDPSRFATVRRRQDVAGLVTPHAVGRLIEVGPADDWPRMTLLQAHVFAFTLPKIAAGYAAYKYTRRAWVAVRNHLMAGLFARLTADPAYHPDLGWVR